MGDMGYPMNAIELKARQELEQVNFPSHFASYGIIRMLLPSSPIQVVLKTGMSKFPAILFTFQSRQKRLQGPIHPLEGEPNLKDPGASEPGDGIRVGAGLTCADET